MSGFEAVIGLEVHAQLSTRSKIFCGCPTGFGQPANTLVCPVCLGHPGALPVLNARAVELALTASLALGCTIPPRSCFARKNYFYPDLPKGYQISQYDRPLARGGSVQIEVNGRQKRIRLIRLHMEEDAGKSIHDGMPDSDRSSYVDLNRAGTPLVEVVSEPDLRSPEEAYLFLQRLRSMLRYVAVCDGNMEQGSLRCDANVSLRREGESRLGTRTEVKNLNSFRNVRRALEFEISRQGELLASGGEVVQETILWDASAGVTRSMRGKEEAHDYRYFPDPDLPPLEPSRSLIERLSAELPELPAARKQRLISEYRIGEREAHRLTLEPELAAYFEQVARLSGNPKAAANFLLNDLLREQKADESPALPAEHLAELIALVEGGTISATVARQELFEPMLRTGRPPAELMREKGLQQLSDEESLQPLIREVLAESPGQIEQYRAGKTGLLGYFVGQVMKLSGGKANPKTVNALLKGALEEPPEA